MFRTQCNAWFYLLHHFGRSGRIFRLLIFLMPRKFFSEMVTIFHTQDKPLMLLTLFPLCCVSIQITFNPCFIRAQCASAKMETFLFSCAVSCDFFVDPFQLGMPGILCMWSALYNMLLLGERWGQPPLQNFLHIQCKGGPQRHSSVSFCLHTQRPMVPRSS